MVKIENVNKYFNKRKKNQIHVINNTTLEFGKNGLVALLGASGSGKTTLLNAIGGLDKVDKGKIFINGVKITRRNYKKVDKIRNLNIGYIFQDYKLIDNLSVYDNIALALKMIGIKDKKEIKKRIDYVLETLNMYRYRNRLASMLSGGERQRVGIARAIVKNPNIIIADEPTGNLDSKNSLEIMNIIKAISKDKLVILVTHEEELAKFYASRIIEIQDGKVMKDYVNEHNNNLNYRLDNKVYLKEFKEYSKVNRKNIKLDLYSENNEELDVKVVIKDGNIYIQSNNNEKIEVVDGNSNIEFVDDYYREIDKKVYEDYKFDFENVIDKNIKQKYCSILNPISLIINGFKKVLNYSVLRKILLVGFFVSAMFVVYSVSSILGAINIKDEDFIKTNKEYLTVNLPKISVDDFLKYEKYEEIKYVLPGNSKINLNIKYDYWYQTSGAQDTISGSMVSSDILTEENLIYGILPKSKKDIVLDKLTIDNMLKNSYMAKQVGIAEVKDLLGQKVTICEEMGEFTIVGISNLESPSIYVNKDLFINILANTSTSEENMHGFYGVYSTEEQAETERILDYELVKDSIKLEKGRVPQKDYEVIVNISHKDYMPLNKKIDVKANDTKLTVVGYYSSQREVGYYLVNNNTIKYNVINNSSDLTILSSNKEKTIENFKKVNLNVKDAYSYDKNIYIEQKSDSIKSSLLVAGVMLIISLIEAYLMIRSSFLSRIEEIGIYRAIGMKKSDIYKMFLGEIIAITCTASLLGVVLMSYIINVLLTIEFFSNMFVMNLGVALISILLLLVFNMLVGILPVHKVLKKTPAQILSRHDI